MTGQTPLQVYVSHAQVKADQGLLHEFELQLAQFKRQGLISTWDRTKLKPGEDSEKEALANLEAARLVLLLLSTDFIASETCYEKELKLALELEVRKKAQVVPIIVRPCPWKYPPLDALAPLPPEARPIATLRKTQREETFRDIAEWLGNYAREQSRATTFPGNVEPTEELKPLEPTPAPVPESVSYTLTVPVLPNYYLERGVELGALRKLLLEQDGQAVGVTGSGKIGVQGMGGIGKSILAAAALADEAVKAKYQDGIFWLAVGQEPDLPTLQARLGAALGDTRLYTDVGKGREQLNEMLKDKACLVALDDVWDDWPVRYMGTPGPKGALLLTTRRRDVVEKLGAREYRVDVLPPEQALALLARSAGQKVEALPQVAREVARECGYLPLALAMAGSMAYEQSWGTVLDSLRKADLEKVKGNFPGYPYPDLLKALDPSVQDLPPVLKERYLDLAVFPEEETIPLEALGTLWGLNRVETEQAVTDLEQAALVRWDADYLRVTLHDLQRDYVKKQREGHLSTLHSRLIQSYLQNWADWEWANGPNDDYYFEWLAYHLKEAGLFEALRELLLDFQWLQVKLSKSGINGLLADYEYLSGDEEAGLVQEALMLSAHILAMEQAQLAMQLWGRLANYREERSGLKRLLEQAERGGTRPRLRPLFGCLTPPGGPLVHTLEGHTSYVNTVAFSSDGKYLISGSDDRTLKVWDWQRGTCLASFTADWQIWCCALDSDGRTIAAGDNSGQVYFLRLEE